MLQIRHILFPVDFSTRCSATANSVQGLAHRTGAMVTLFHAVRSPLDWIDPPYPEDWKNSLQGEEVSAMVVRLRAERMEMLHGFRPELWNPSHTRYIVELGDTASALLCSMEALNPVLVMIPTHGHGGFKRFLTGSVTTRLLHDAKCPVWTDAHVDELRPGIRDACDHVFCALELFHTERDLRLIRWAREYAAIWNAKVRLMHAVPGAMHIAGQPDEPFGLTLVSWAKENLAALQKQEGTNFETIVEAETPGALASKAVDEPRSSVIVIGRGHHGGLLGRLGSQAYSIIRGASCPIISI